MPSEHWTLTFYCFSKQSSWILLWWTLTLIPVPNVILSQVRRVYLSLVWTKLPPSKQSSWILLWWKFPPTHPAVLKTHHHCDILWTHASLCLVNHPSEHSSGYTRTLWTEKVSQEYSTRRMKISENSIISNFNAFYYFMTDFCPCVGHFDDIFHCVQ